MATASESERGLAVIGAAVKALPSEATAVSPETPWASIAGLRNIVVHEYFRVDRGRVKVRFVELTDT